jgi:hypothetical protein
MRRLVSNLPAHARVRQLAACTTFAAVLGLQACGGDGGVEIGDGQEPDPVVLDFPVAYVKRPLTLDDDGVLVQGDLRELDNFEVGANLWVRDRASPTALETNITESIVGELGDVRGVDVDYDGSRFVFAMRGPRIEDADDDDQPTWNIWEYVIATQELRRVIASDIVAEEGQDIDPHYLPDGRIVFSSTRQRQSGAILLDEGKPQFAAQDEDRNEPAFVLHVMNDDGSDIRQVSFNQSHDRDPSVLANGEIVYSRWDNAGGQGSGIALYRMRPDGTNLEQYYGTHSHATGTDGGMVQFVQPRELPDGRLLGLLMPFTDSELGGDIVVIDTGQYIENTQPTQPNIGVLSGPAQEPATTNIVRTDDLPSPGGRYSSAYPLWDGTHRILVSWSECRLLENAATPDERIVPCTAEALADPAAVPARPLYGVWLYDPAQSTMMPVLSPVEDVMYTDVVVAEPRARPAVILDGTAGVDLDQDLVAEGAGVLDIRSIYDVDGVDTANPGIVALADPARTTAAERPARFVRVVKAVSIPDPDVFDFSQTAFGVGTNVMREIVAYAPIEPDGSVKLKVPADVALDLSVIDADGRRIGPQHRNWLQVRAGEVLRCNGCHDAASGEAHGRSDAYASVNAGATTTGLPFPNTDPAIFADFGETMAQARARVSCATDCAALTPSVDVVYDDVWTDEAAAGRAKDASFAYRYTDLDTPPPVADACLDAWSASCRIVINYEQHIHPLWAKPRQVLDDDGVTVLSDNTCTLCHNPVDAMGAAQVPAGQLDLTDGPSTDEPDHFKAYRELLVDDNEEAVMGALQDRLVEVGVDPVTGDPILVTVPVSASMSAGSANDSRFFDEFAPGGTHAGFLTPAELRLLSEWLDIGAQYYNNPFAAPPN